MPTVTVSIPVDGTVVPQKAEKVGGKRIGFYYIILKSLKESKKNDVVKCLYIMGLTKFGYCVIKEGSAGDTKDKDGRDIQDRLKWQRDLHGRWGKSLSIPRLLGEFEENGNYYLVMEYMKGKPLYEFVKYNRGLRQSLLDGSREGKKVLGYLREAVAILAEFHKHGIVHRDATLNNFMVTSGGKVVILDMELSYSLNDKFPNPPFALGTHGYMSPQQEALEMPTVKEDVFAAGAMIFHAWCGISPYKFVNMPYSWLERAVRFFVPVTSMADLILQCLHPDPGTRPDAIQLHAALDKEIASAQRPEIKLRPAAWSDGGVYQLLHDSIQGMGTPMFADPEKGWFAEHLIDRSGHTNEIRKGWYASLTCGASGVLYFLARAFSVEFDITALATPIGQALKLIRLKYVDNVEKSNSGLHFGSDGVALALAETLRYGMLDESEALQRAWPEMLRRKAESLSLRDGLAGQGIARLSCSGYISTSPSVEIVEELRSEQLANGAWMYNKKRPRPYFIGGMAGVIYYLLCHGKVYSDPTAIESALRGLDFLRTTRRNGIGVPFTWKKNREHVSDHCWAEGNPGMAITWLKAWEVTGISQYRVEAEMLLSNLNESMVWRNMGLNYGMCGLGETYLEAARILSDERYLQRARQLGDVLLHTVRSNKYGPYWLVNKESQPVTGLMSGNTGVLHFLLRTLHPGKFSFPGLI